MSFLETIRGFGRSSKKNKKDDPASSIYSHLNISGHISPRKLSPTKLSPSKRKSYTRQLSPSRDHIRRSVPAGQALPTRSNHTHLSQFPPDALSKEFIPLEKPPLFMSEPFVKTSLVKGSFKTIVQLPKYVDHDEWLALNIFELFDNLNLFYSVIADYVASDAYPTMNAGPNTDYLWISADGQAVNLPAYQYIDRVLTWVSSKINDQAVFPTSNGGAFPQTFMKDCKSISRQMFRIFAHVYHNHFDKLVHLSLEAHWNSFFSNFISLVKTFDLIERREMAPLLPLIEEFESQGKII